MLGSNSRDVQRPLNSTPIDSTLLVRNLDENDERETFGFKWKGVCVVRMTKEVNFEEIPTT